MPPVTYNRTSDVPLVSSEQRSCELLAVNLWTFCISLCFWVNSRMFSGADSEGFQLLAGSEIPKASTQKLLETGRNFSIDFTGFWIRFL